MVEALEKKVDRLETRIDATDNKLAEVFEKFNNLIFELKITMNTFNSKIEQFSDIKTQMDKLECRIATLEESGKINWFQLVKSGLGSFLVATVLGGSILYVVLAALDKIK